MSWWESVPELDSVDVLVVGSGSAGSTAAISAARLGANTMLIEKLPFLGGTSTAVLDTFYGFYTPGEHSKKIVGGVPDDVIAGLSQVWESRGAPEHLWRWHWGHLQLRAPETGVGGTRR